MGVCYTHIDQPYEDVMLRCSIPSNEPVLPQMTVLALPLHPAHGRLLLELLEGSHGVHVESTRKLHEARAQECEVF